MENQTLIGSDEQPAKLTAAELRQPATGTPSRRRFSLRGFTSILLSLAFLVLLVSGIILFLTPRGRTANWTDWTMLGLGKHSWGALHIANSILFVVVAAIHLFLNWAVLVRYIKTKASAGLNMKREMALAGVVAVACVAGSIYELPPFGNVMVLNDSIKNYWDRQAADAPAPHADEFTLAQFAEQINLPVDDITAALEKEGFEATDTNQTVRQIAESKDVPPNEVFAAIRAHHPQVGQMGGGRGPGWSRGGGFGAGEGCSSGDGKGQDVGEGAEHGPGPGWGRGMGMGRGRGMGMGPGRGMGLGQGPGHEKNEGKNEVDTQE